MSRLFFISLLIFLTLIRPFISILVVVVRPLIPFFKKRLDFERKNFVDQAHLNHFHADLCFEVSSEGELEQVRALISKSIAAGKKIEILYSSPSVETKCQALYQASPESVRLMRLPLLSAFPFDFLYFRSIWQWVSAPVIIFCRYDFFPEMMLLKFFNKKFILVSGAFKKMSWYKEESFKFFDLVIAATDLEKKNFEDIMPKTSKIYSCDFRVPRIDERYQRAQEVIAKKTSITIYIEKISKLPLDKKIILGSAWESDLNILNHPDLIAAVKSQDLHILVLPHKLDGETISKLRLRLEEIFGKGLVGVMNEETPYNNESVVILQMGGILCELYSLFKLSYVGGGYERSIHSVLEPLFSNSAVVTGPAINRSTEYDLAVEVAPGEIHVLNNPETFYTIIKSIDVSALNVRARAEFKDKTSSQMNNIFQDILGSSGC